MKAGKVVQIRLNPKDCMAVSDLLELAGVNTKGMSFSRAVALAFSGVCEGFREQGIIPERDGFEYSQMMRQWQGKSHKEKIRVTESVSRLGSGWKPPAITGTPYSGEPPNFEMTPEQKRAGVRMEELLFKKEHDPANFSADEQAEYDKLEKIIYG